MENPVEIQFVRSRFDIPDLILHGIKTHTRRPIIAGERECPFGPVGRLLTWWYSPRERRSQARGRVRVETVGIKLRTLAVRWETLKEISEDDLVREGNLSREAFYRAWDTWYPKEYCAAKNPMVWVIEFERLRPWPFSIVPWGTPHKHRVHA